MIQFFIDVDGWGDGPHSTPAVDESFVYGFSAHGLLTAVNKKDGKIEWKVDFIKELGSTLPRWGFSTSPLLIEDLLVMEAGGKDEKAFVAFNKKDGKVVWTKGKGNSLYNSPTIASINGITQILFSMEATCIRLILKVIHYGPPLQILGMQQLCLFSLTGIKSSFQTLTAKDIQ
ncbi:MAG: PQQ-binding-like beta-propeller repeat protein [Chloroflexia bacterium]|nr:PQQ-binding-like beta-propeller repeat protein [Chloroflexia bacterium]